MAKQKSKYYGPQVVGGTYLCGYWRKTYTVLALDQDGWITVQWHDSAESPAHVGRHMTGWDSRRDRVISQPIQP